MIVDPIINYQNQNPLQKTSYPANQTPISLANAAWNSFSQLCQNQYN